MEDTSKPTPDQEPEGFIYLDFRDHSNLSFVKGELEYEGRTFMDRLREFYKDIYLGRNADDEQLSTLNEWKWVMFKRFLHTLLRIKKAEGSDHNLSNSVLDLISRMLEFDSFSFIDDGRDEVERGIEEICGQLSVTKVYDRDENDQWKSRFVFMDSSEREKKVGV